MRILQVGFLSFGLMLASSLPALSQNSDVSSPQVTANDAPGQKRRNAFFTTSRVFQ
jgi:hypothetical protein